MRSHGVPNFPDPVNGQIVLHNVAGSSSNINTSSPAFQSAQQTCQKLVPGFHIGGSSGTGAQNPEATALLKFSACMQSHGEPNFPDPTISGGSVKMQLPPSVDPNSPQFQSAYQACQSLLPAGANFGGGGGGGS
jgi:hypothetical protein